MMAVEAANLKWHLPKILGVLAGGDFCCLLINFANSLNPDHDQQNVGPDHEPNCLTL